MVRTGRPGRVAVRWPTAVACTAVLALPALAGCGGDGSADPAAKATHGQVTHRATARAITDPAQARSILPGAGDVPREWTAVAPPSGADPFPGATASATVAFRTGPRTAVVFGVTTFTTAAEAHKFYALMAANTVGALGEGAGTRVGTRLGDESVGAFGAGANPHGYLRVGTAVCTVDGALTGPGLEAAMRLVAERAGQVMAGRTPTASFAAPAGGGPVILPPATD